MKSPFADLAALKKSTDLVAVVQARGVKLTKQGADFVGLCPFKEEKTPSFHVTPSKNLFHCFGCGAAGSVIDFVMRKDGLTKQEAIDWLVKRSGGAIRRADMSAVASAKVEAVAVASPGVSDGDRSKLLQRVVAFYAKTLLQDRDGFDYLKRRNLADPTALEIFQVGYCNGTLNKALPKSGETIEQLKAIGILNQHGRETFSGRVVVPIFDHQGNVCGLYGRKIEDADPRHLYLRGERRGVWNSTAAKVSQSLFVTESIFDGLALWQAGFKNVIAIYGTEGWTPDHETLIRENGITGVIFALDNDEPGQAAMERIRERLSVLTLKGRIKPAIGMQSVLWPEGVKDAAEFFLSRSAADFAALLPKEAEASAVAEASADKEQVEMTPDGFAAVFASRRYELRAIEKPTAARLKATVKAVTNCDRFHIDTVDFYLSRSRRGFLIESARLFREVPEVVEMDVNRLITQLETYVEKRAVETGPRVTLVSESEKAEGLKLGQAQDLVGEILRDLEKLGLIGERQNGLLGYLAMTSRKLDDPLALLILSGSGAGKSHLQDTVLSLCPEEDLVKVTSLSDQALYYKGEDALRHKVLAIEEEAGALGADYAIRNLISAKKLVREVTIKNPLTGKMETQTSRVNGPAAVLKTTTNPETNAETRSRFFVTSVDESAGQTRAIVEAQRNRNTIEGLLRRQEAAAIVARHQAFQRLLRPLRIVNPFEPLLTYGDDRLLVRRDNPKYLRLILVVAFLHQMQRPVKNHPVIGDYIEVTLDDIATANDLALQVLGQSVDELSAPSRRLLHEIAAYVGARATVLKIPLSKVEFSRRELREALKWSESRLRIHLAELAQMEYLAPTGGRRGLLYCYRLVYEGEAAPGSRFLPGLKTVEQLRQEMPTRGGTSPVKTEVRRSFGHFAGGSPVPTGEVPEGDFQRGNDNGKGPFAGFGRGHIPGKKVNGSRVAAGMDA